MLQTEELSLQKHQQNVVLHTTQACWDLSQGFRCKVKTNGTKLSYKALPTKKKITVYKCCHGYYETPEETCEVCLEGYYGNNCSLHCNCSENEICDNVIGCCDLLTKSCRIMRSAAVKEFTESSSWLFPALLASLLAVVVLTFGTFFYRRKYRKEKDPDLPTLTYYPNVKELLTQNEIEAREFNNPMYRRSAIEVMPIKIIPNEQVPIAKNAHLRSSSVTHEYATLDYALSSSPYEVPLHSTPSPITRSIENLANEEKK
ncbi:Cell death abnormality protein 1 [Dirofilaria immitis]|nr:Cell death abnormality protein 1 [Dirofilaria immitis]